MIKVTVGDKSRFALEAGLSEARPEWGHLALGYFEIHILGHRYGVHEPNATMLGCSYQTVRRLLASRGDRQTAISSWPDAREIADAYIQAVYADPEPGAVRLGLDVEELRRIIRHTGIVWAPDGDEAFDDGSHVLQFDIGDQVRLIGFRTAGDSHEPGTLQDAQIPAGEFYETLGMWLHRFEVERDDLLRAN